ncbi:hypothetical protein MKY96_32780 [Paenibacillus sp. FSL R7-0302]|uniref:hypothetical protein n=1 Tax=Paenibacillus sp. FSL R7-0302 TaxID=2921681 RepID=UPI0030F91076
MAAKQLKSGGSTINLELYRKTRSRSWGAIKPVTQVVPDKKKKNSKKACRSKVVE